jgi:hypothetical protein
MQSNFFIVWIGLPILGLSMNRSAERLRPCRRPSFAGAPGSRFRSSAARDS